MSINDQIPNIAYIGILIPLAGMSIGAFSIWTEHQRKQKALEVLKIYAQQGTEPPQSVIDSVSRVSGRHDWKDSDHKPQAPWSRFAFFIVMALGFGLAALWFNQGGAKAWPITLGLGITSFVMAALAMSALVQALTAPRSNAD